MKTHEALSAWAPIACTQAGNISEAALARLIGVAPTSFSSSKFGRDGLTVSRLCRWINAWNQNAPAKAERYRVTLDNNAVHIVPKTCLQGHIRETHDYGGHAEITIRINRWAGSLPSAGTMVNIEQVEAE